MEGINKKRELVIVCNNCFPIPSATGALAMNCVNYLYEDFNIRVVSIQDRNHKYYAHDCGRYELYTVGNLRLNLFQRVSSRAKEATGIKRMLCQALTLLTRTLGKIDRTLFHIDSYKWFERKSLRMLKKLNKEKKIDVVISVSEPVRSHFAAMKFKQKFNDVRWVCYWGDLYATEYFRSNIFHSVNKMLEAEKRITACADHVLTNDEILAHYSEICDADKVSHVPYTLRSAILGLDSQDRLQKSRFIYFGSFSPTMRNPEYMLKLFAASDLSLELYSSGCEAIIDKYAAMSNGRIKAMGFIEPQRLRERVLDSDVLINMGNTDSDFLPSKTLELLSYKKPILDFYYGDNQASLLTKYPALLRIRNDSDVEESLKALKEFVATVHNVSADDVYTVFGDYTEEKAKSIILAAVK